MAGSAGSAGGAPVALRPLSADALPRLRDLNAALFPVAYSDAFYRGLLAAPQDLVRLAYAGGALVGAVCCRVEEGSGELGAGGDQTNAAAVVVRLNAARQAAAAGAAAAGDAPPARMYIMTLGVRATHRERGVGGLLLRHVMEAAARAPCAVGVREVYLHVQVGNDDALDFYARRGFVVRHRLPNYYRKIHPRDCYYVCRPVGRVDEDGGGRGGG